MPMYKNDFGTVIETDEATFKELKKVDGSNYRLLRSGEIPPIQASEVEAVGGNVPVTLSVSTPDANAVKRLRRAQAKDDGATDEADA
jgi:hypothetical protein